MSLVGPRPPLPGEVDRYESDAVRRLRVRPGMTGLWQVSGRSDLSWVESVRLDLWYVDNWSLALDRRSSCARPAPWSADAGPTDARLGPHLISSPRLRDLRSATAPHCTRPRYAAAPTRGPTPRGAGMDPPAGPEGGPPRSFGGLSKGSEQS